MGAEHIELLFGVGGERQIADQIAVPDEQEEGPEEREPLGRHLVGHVPAGDVVPHQRVDHLHCGLDPVRARLHPSCDVHHRDDRQDRGQE